MSNIEILTDDQIFVIRLIAQIISSISIFGCLVVFCLYCLFKEIRQIALELVVWLCFSVFFFSLTAFIPFDVTDSSFWCATQSYMITSFQISSILWCTIIGFTAYIGVNDPSKLELNESKYRLYFILIALVAPMVISSM